MKWKWKGMGKGKERVRWQLNEALAETENLRLSRESNLDTLTNVADALPLIYQDRRHHLPVCSTSLTAVPPLHNIDIMQCPPTNPLWSRDRSWSAFCIPCGLKE